MIRTRQTPPQKKHGHRSTIAAMAIVAISSISSTEALATDPPVPNIDCTQAISNIELKYCAEQAYQAAERQLDRTYQQVLTRLDFQEQQRLREIQQTWTGFRDRNCELEVSPTSGGTGYGLFLHQCLERLTLARTIDLENYFTIRQEPISSNPSNPKVQIADLPDGNYRYWTGTPQGLTVTDEELINGGGILFRFRKSGDRIVGIYGRIDDETICINGRISGNTVAGNAVQTEEPFIPAIVLSSDDNFAAWDESAYLKVRRGRRAGNYARYESALLELSNFNRINAGSQLPPGQCP
ncbi:MAG: lysozyme inhibitor LprI family protein [Geitlerinemataceae cyanobacterium]